MTKQAYIKFQWKAEQDEQWGTATFTYNNDEVYVEMNDFQHAMFLHSMIESALEQCRVDTLDSVETNITNLLHKKRYE